MPAPDLTESGQQPSKHTSPAGQSRHPPSGSVSSS